MRHTLSKCERLNRRKIVETMFSGGARSFSFFPLRVVYMPVADLDVSVSILASVSKRRFKRAVKRNRVKRQIREAYRLNKHLLTPVLSSQEGLRLAVAFIYLADRIMDTSLLENRMKGALSRIAETLSESTGMTSAEPASISPLQP